MFMSKTSQGNKRRRDQKAFLQLNCHGDKVGEIQLF